MTGQHNDSRCTATLSPPRPVTPSIPQSSSLDRLVAVTVIGLLLAAGITLAGRRLAGALENPLSWQAMLSAGILLAAAPRAGRISNPSHFLWTDWKSVLHRFLTSAGVFSVAVSLTMSAAPLAATMALWVPVAAAELSTWGARFCRTWPPTWLGKSRRAAEEDMATRHAPPATRHPFRDAAGVAGQDVVQQLVRSRAADGTETLRGWLRAAVASGQRTACVHIAFCPPFARAPRVSVEQREGPPARIKTGQVLPHGARFDLKLAQSSETEAAILLEFSAEEEPGMEDEG